MTIGYDSCRVAVESSCSNIKNTFNDCNIGQNMLHRSQKSCTHLFDIFSTTSRKIPPLCNVVLLKSTTFNKTHAIFSFNVQFCPRLYLLSTLLFDIFNTTTRKIPPPCAMLFRSKALHLTRLVRFFRLMYSFVQRLYLLYMYLGLDVTCIFCNLSRQVKYRC